MDKNKQEEANEEGNDSWWIPKCEDCGVQDGSAELTTCPYAEDINNIKVEVVLCPDCHYERLQDI